MTTLSKEEKLKEYRKKYYLKNKEYFKQKFQDYYQNNKNEIKEKSNEYYHNNIDYYQNKFKDYRTNNRDIINEYDRNYRKNNPQYGRWRNLLKNTLEKLGGEKINETIQMLGYSANELKEHLDKQGMNWDEHEIDHKIPITWFNENTPPNIVNDLRNLHPLTKEENNSKLNRYNHPIDKEYYDLILKHIKNEYKENIK